MINNNSGKLILFICLILFVSGPGIRASYFWFQNDIWEPGDSVFKNQTLEFCESYGYGDRVCTVLEIDRDCVIDKIAVVVGGSAQQESEFHVLCFEGDAVLPDPGTQIDLGGVNPPYVLNAEGFWVLDLQDVGASIVRHAGDRLVVCLMYMGYLTMSDVDMDICSDADPAGLTAHVNLVRRCEPPGSDWEFGEDYGIGHNFIIRAGWEIPDTPTPTANPTMTMTPTPQWTITPTPTTTFTMTPTAQPTRTMTPTGTATMTPTATFTWTCTPTATRTGTPTPTSTGTATATPSPSGTPVPPSPTGFPSFTPSPTPGFTVTPSPTPSMTPSATITPTRTPTCTASPTVTQTPTPTRTATRTPTYTPSPSVTPTETPTRTGTPTCSPTPQFTYTPEPTYTPYPTNTPIPPSPTQTATATPPPTPTPTREPYRLPFFDNFEDLLGWEVQEHHGTCLWHRETARYYSFSHSWAYNRGDPTYNYNTGTRNSCSLISPRISLVGSTNPMLEFFDWIETEQRSDFDICAVEIATNDGNNWLPIYSTTASTREWTQRGPFDLSAYIGNIIRIRFRFDTIDSQFNQFEGWYIDDVRIEDKPLNTPTPTPYSGEPGVDLRLNSEMFYENMPFLLELDYLNPNPSPLPADIWIVLDVYGSYWYWPDWKQEPVHETRTMPAQAITTEVILDFTWPHYDGSFDDVLLWAAALEPGTANLIGNYDNVRFGCNK